MSLTSGFLVRTMILFFALSGICMIVAVDPPIILLSKFVNPVIIFFFFFVFDILVSQFFKMCPDQLHPLGEQKKKKKNGE
jgi:hypothetical protein